MKKEINDIIALIKEKHKLLGIIMGEPASDNDIRKFEAALGLTLPKEIKAFYKFCNGFESDEDLFRIIPLDEIIDSKQDFKPNQFYIAEYLIYCDVWTVDINPGDPEDFGIYNSDQDLDWLYLTASFTEFLDCFLANGVFGEGGLYDWHNEVKLKVR